MCLSCEGILAVIHVSQSKEPPLLGCWADLGYKCTFLMICVHTGEKRLI